MVENGDVYELDELNATWVYEGNMVTGMPTPTRQSSFGAVKAQYR